MKKLIVILAAMVGCFVAIVLLYHWDSDTNHGFQFGYYGGFNRLSNALASIPGLTITQSWHNCDVTLEEFGFTATIGPGEAVRIAVGENDRIRTLSGDPLLQALKAEIWRQAKR